MMEEAQQPEQLTTYYVVFTQGVTHWVTRWLLPNFSHIYLVTKDDYNWVILNPTRLYLQCVLPAALVTDEYPLTMLKENDSCVKITFKKRDDTKQFGSVGMLNCVTWSKYILGLRIWCLTPFGLYKRLVNFNASDKERHGITAIERIKDYDWTRNAMESRP